MVVLGPGFEAISVVTGPMGRNVQDLIFFMKVSPKSHPQNTSQNCSLNTIFLLGQTLIQTILRENLSSLDSGVIPNPWNDSVFMKYAAKKLKFGYYFDDGVTIASPPVKRAVEMTAKALQAKGHEVVELLPPNIIEAVHCFVALTTYEGSHPSFSPSNPSLCFFVPSPISFTSFLYSVACLYNLILYLSVDTQISANQSPKTPWNQRSNSS